MNACTQTPSGGPIDLLPTSYCTGKGQYDSNTKDPLTKYKTITIEALYDLVRNPQAVPKEQAFWFIPTPYHDFDARSNTDTKNQRVYTLCVADVDSGNLELDQVVKGVRLALGEVKFVVYSTRSSTEVNKKWRVLISLAHEVPYAHYKALQMGLRDILAAVGIVSDLAVTTPTQIIYLPNRGEHYQSHFNEGPELDLMVCTALNQAARVQAAELQKLSHGSGVAKVEGSRSYLRAFRHAHATQELMEQKGWASHDGIKWLSPDQDGHSASTMVYEDGAFSTMSSTVGERYGMTQKPSGLWVGADGFDLYRIEWCEGNLAQATVYAKQCLAAEDAFFVEHGKALWEGCLTIGPNENGEKSFGPASGIGPAEATTTPVAVDLTSSSPTFQLSFATGDEVTKEQTYLIDPWLPASSVVGMFGDGESGKSTHCSTLCAQASDHVSTLWISSEEEETNVKVRYTKTGGHTNTLVATTHMPLVVATQTHATFNCFEHLEKMVLDVKQMCHPDRPLGIVVLDAIGTLVTWGHGESANDDGGVKRLIAYLTTVATQHDVSIVMIGHMKKFMGRAQGKDAVTGSAAWTNSVRKAFLFYKDEAGEDYHNVIRTAKANTGTHFAATYKTVPVHTITAREDGRNDVLCKTEFTSDIVWGTRDINAFLNDSDDEDPYLQKKKNRASKKDAMFKFVVETIRSGTRTRKGVIEAAATVGTVLHNRHFADDIDQRLALECGISMEKGAHGAITYLN
jgi:hypothetical protein